MLDLGHIPFPSTAIQQIFYAGTPTAGTNWQVWNKPRGVSFVHIFLLGGGGGGAAGTAGGNNAAGGGGGASGQQGSYLYPAYGLPNTLFVSVGVGGAQAAAGIDSFVSITTSNTLNFLVANAAGGNGATAGTAGGTTVARLIGTTPLVGLSILPRLLLATNVNLASQAGAAGGTTGAGASVILPTTGLIVTGGTGGGGRGGAGAAGFAGGAFTVPAGSVFPANPGGTAAGSVTGNGGPGSNGFQAIPNLGYFYGGTGGGSAGTTSGTGGNGGQGGYGCGGGGGGACLTGQTPGSGGRGGNGLCIITAY